MASKKGQKARARELLAQRRAEEARRRRRIRFSLIGAGAVVVVLLATAITWAAVTGDDDDDGGGSRATPTVGTGRPPWPVPDDPLEGARAAGLDVTEMEGTAEHFHSHLDILVDGKPVQVPANIGVAQTGMSELHTHDAGGLLHVEAPTAGKRYTLGQLFRTWQVRLTANAIGGLETGDGDELRAYVDGERVTGDLANIELGSRKQIVLVYGPADEQPDLPTYTFTED
ncbi:MAG: hypothetical protein GEV07_15025 [Streptosporangiales bacterium]|nr:hypothetical protein [Streptosporangiales bacterium]